MIQLTGHSFHTFCNMNIENQSLDKLSWQIDREDKVWEEVYRRGSFRIAQKGKNVPTLGSWVL